jgi:hypothetical protein
MRISSEKDGGSITIVYRLHLIVPLRYVVFNYLKMRLTK